ncbi:MAG TPA: nucleoside-diphosphate sugar epimerase, partial [Ramlibacter sp.]|nr:nucleoside-diphosphate sugar epimerase [Ramlibacter sp.]
ARPSLLVGDRAALGQPERRGEKIGEQVGRWLKPLVPANYRPITAAQVAGALLRAVSTARGQQVLLSGQMQAS